MRFRMLLFMPALALMSSCGEDTKDWTPLASGEPKPPHLELFANSFLFGATYVGERATDTLLVGNTGEAPLVVAISVSGNWFSVFPDTATILSGHTASIQVVFSPGQEGRMSDSLRISTNEPDTSLYHLSLAGFALFRPPPPLDPPLMRVAVTEVAFGDVLVGGRGTQIVTVVNLGERNLELNISFDGPPGSPFSAVPQEASIAPGSHVNVTVTFEPEDESSVRGVLEVYSNDPARLRETVMLSGSGFRNNDSVPNPDPTPDPEPEPDPDPDPEPDPAVVSVSVPNIVFEPVLIGNVRSQAFLVTNTGGSLLNASIGFNARTGQFAVSPRTVSIMPGASEIVTVSFAPNEVGGFLAEVLVMSTGQDMSYGTVSLSGSGFRNNDPIPNPDPIPDPDPDPTPDPAPEIIQASALVNGRSYSSGARFGATVGDVVTFSLETGNAGDAVRWEQRVGTAIEPQGEGRELIYTLPNTTFILEIVAIVTNEGGAQSAVSWKIQVLAR